MEHQELTEMNNLMKSLENDIQEMVNFNEKLKKIAEKKQKLAEFYEEKWMDFYDEADQYAHLEILNQDSLWNAIADSDAEARMLIKNAANLI